MIPFNADQKKHRSKGGAATRASNRKVLPELKNAGKWKSGRPGAEDKTSIDKLIKNLDELESLNRDLMGMIENSYDGFAVLDGDTQLLLLNPAFERVMGLKKSETLGRKTRDLVKEGVSDTAASLKVIESGKPQTVLLRTKAGRQVLSTGVPVFDRDGKISRIYCNLRDITELNQLKEKYQQSQKLISKYLIELQEVKKARSLKSEFVAHSKQMTEILETAFRIAMVDATVLILGESGVGKELVARMIHEASPRADTGVFVKINCAAIPAELLESELFGYEAGAFTGASREGKPGYFEIADKGTLLLDEIADLSPGLQVKLLSVIQDQEVTRLGDTRPKKVDVRLLAATDQDLEKMVRTGKFREALYYRLNVVPLTIPPLRERRDDIPFLLVHFLEKYNEKYGFKKRLSKGVIEALTAHQWPGNIRELSNLVEHLVVLSDEDTIEIEHLPKKLHNFHEKNTETPRQMVSLKKEMEAYELEVVSRVVAQSKTLEEAAHILGISLSTLTRRLRLLKNDGQY